MLLSILAATSPILELGPDERSGRVPGEVLHASSYLSRESHNFWSQNDFVDEAGYFSEEWLSRARTFRQRGTVFAIYRGRAASMSATYSYARFAAAIPVISA